MSLLGLIYKENREQILFAISTSLEILEEIKNQNNLQEFIIITIPIYKILICYSPDNSKKIRQFFSLVESFNEIGNYNGIFPGHVDFLENGNLKVGVFIFDIKDHTITREEIIQNYRLNLESNYVSEIPIC